jgi:hypothetical protein
MRWKVSVWVRIKSGPLEAITNPEEALERLTDQWPKPRARHFRSAVTNCEAAVSGQYSPELAREAFVRASLEAAVLVQGIEKRETSVRDKAVHAAPRSASIFFTA